MHRSNPDRSIRPPDAGVAKLEDALQRASKSATSLGQLTTFPLRPGYGTRGAPVMLCANHVELGVSSILVLYCYDIAVTPVVGGRKLAQIVRLLLQEPDLAELRTDALSDFKLTLISRRKTPDAKKFVLYLAEGEDAPRISAARYDVRLQYVGTLAAAEFIEYLTATDLAARHDDKLPTIQAFNINDMRKV